MKEIRVNEGDSNQRFDKFLKRVLINASPAFIYKMLRKKNITLNDKRADGSERLKVNDIVKIWFSDETFEKMTSSSSETSLFDSLQKVNLKLDIVYEDETMIIINKPAGVKSQKDEVNEISINEMAIAYLINKGEVTRESFKHFHPSVCNRLDRNTSGIILFAKTLQAARDLGQMLKDRACKKLYRAIVVGEINESQLIEGFLTKDEITNTVRVSSQRLPDSKPIMTSYRPIKNIGGLTLIEIHLITGRTHQIRAHLASINHPILGDYKYGISEINERYKAKRQLLHAYSIELKDGRRFVCDLPGDFNEYI